MSKKLALSWWRVDFFIDVALIINRHFRNVFMLLRGQNPSSQLLSPELTLLSTAGFDFSHRRFLWVTDKRRFLGGAADPRT
jgi:hypothetical protein